MTEIFVALCAGCGALAVSAEKSLCDMRAGEHEQKYFDLRNPKSAAHATVVVQAEYLEKG